MSNTALRLATFRADVTPPLGSPLCGGNIAPVRGVTDPLYALGLLLFPEGENPLVLCAVDWCEICNADHALWRERLAEAVETTPERVAVQCVHQHDAPITDLVAQQLHQEYRIVPPLMDEPAFYVALEEVAKAAQAAVSQAVPVTHFEVGKAPVSEIASNRRVPAPDGTLRIRWSRCTDPALRAEPAGSIDPFLKTLRFYQEDTPLVALHYYAVHPMSYYGDGWVTADFVGMARERCTREDGFPHLYFTECAGDITAGKYNDGSPENRPLLAERLYQGIRASEQQTERHPMETLTWRVTSLLLPPRTPPDATALLQTVADASQPRSARTLAALWLSFTRRMEAHLSIPLTALHLGDRLCLLHLPGEALIAYQLYAQSLRPDATVLVASYGDIGMGYIPLAQHFQEVGGYEETWAFAAPESETLLKQALRELLQK